MRKAGKKRIAEAMKEFDEWIAIMQPRIDALTVPGAAKELNKWVADVKSRITDGELAITTYALSASVVRNIKSCEEGYFKSVENETWHVA